MKFWKKVLFKFTNAFRGIKFGVKNDKSIQIQLFFMLTAIVISLFLKVSTLDFILITIVSTIVVAVEFLNSAIEMLSDFASENKYYEKIKIVKDLSAAAVLITATFALIVGILVFSKYIL